jgi:hypothetical protein
MDWTKPVLYLSKGFGIDFSPLLGLSHYKTALVYYPFFPKSQFVVDRNFFT